MSIFTALEEYKTDKSIQDSEKKFWKKLEKKQKENKQKTLSYLECEAGESLYALLVSQKEICEKAFKAGVKPGFQSYMQGRYYTICMMLDFFNQYKT